MSKFPHIELIYKGDYRFMPIVKEGDPFVSVCGSDRFLVKWPVKDKISLKVSRFVPTQGKSSSSEITECLKSARKGLFYEASKLIEEKFSEEVIKLMPIEMSWEEYDMVNLTLTALVLDFSFMES